MVSFLGLGGKGNQSDATAQFHSSMVAAFLSFANRVPVLFSSNCGLSSQE